MQYYIILWRKIYVFLCEFRNFVQKVVWCLGLSEKHQFEAKFWQVAKKGAHYSMIFKFYIGSNSIFPKVGSLYKLGAPPCPSPKILKSSIIIQFCMKNLLECFKSRLRRSKIMKKLYMKVPFHNSPLLLTSP